MSYDNWKLESPYNDRRPVVRKLIPKKINPNTCSYCTHPFKDEELIPIVTETYRKKACKHCYDVIRSPLMGLPS